MRAFALALPLPVSSYLHRAERGHYLTMMNARIALVGGSGASLARAATIAIRYSLVRKQVRAT
eukprot:COSAG05_NODE_6133_length_1017_cov_1.066449_2_plen_63_part_00